jgi:hypothetical protein
VWVCVGVCGCVCVCVCVCRWSIESTGQRMNESLGKPLSEWMNQRVCKIFNFIYKPKQGGSLQVELTSII